MVCSQSIYDSKEDQIILVRDKLELNLYTFMRTQIYLHFREIKSLLKFGSVKKRLTMNQYMII